MSLFIVMQLAAQPQISHGQKMAVQQHYMRENSMPLVTYHDSNMATTNVQHGMVWVNSQKQASA